MHAIAALYLHIPFCHHICPFCAFAIHGNQSHLHEPYVNALIQEWEKMAVLYKDSLLPLESVYFGGGTPSALPPEHLFKLMAALRSCFTMSEDCEIALEINPEDADSALFEALHELGVNRVSIGIQSFQHSTLTHLNRNHTAKQAIKAVEQVKQSAIDNVNLDLMFGVPEQSLEDFKLDLETLLEFAPSHVSLYGLDIEPGTLFDRKPAIRDQVRAGGDLQACMYLLGVERLNQAGLKQYEVSNFALEGHEGRSNLMVWSGKAYLGSGLGAHSFHLQKRWNNHRSLKTYLTSLHNGILPIARQEVLSGSQQAEETLMLALRQTKGLDLGHWIRHHGRCPVAGWSSQLTLMQSQSLVIWEPPHLRLTPAGMLLADEITTNLALALPDATVQAQPQTT